MILQNLLKTHKKEKGIVRAARPPTLQWEENRSHTTLKPLESSKARQKGQLLHVDKRGFI